MMDEPYILRVVLTDAERARIQRLKEATEARSMSEVTRRALICLEQSISTKDAIE